MNWTWCDFFSIIFITLVGVLVRWLDSTACEQWTSQKKYFQIYLSQSQLSHLSFMSSIQVDQNSKFVSFALRFNNSQSKTATNNTNRLFKVSEWLTLLTVGSTAGAGFKDQNHRWAGQNHHLTFKTHPFYCSGHLKDLVKWSRSHQLELLTLENERVMVTSLSSWIDSVKGENCLFYWINIIIIQHQHSFYMHIYYTHSIIVFWSSQTQFSLSLTIFSSFLHIVVLFYVYLF